MGGFWSHLSSLHDCSYSEEQCKICIKVVRKKGYKSGFVISLVWIRLAATHHPSKGTNLRGQALIIPMNSLELTTTTPAHDWCFAFWYGKWYSRMELIQGFVVDWVWVKILRWVGIGVLLLYGWNQVISRAFILLFPSLLSLSRTLIHRQEWGTCKHSDA